MAISMTGISTARNSTYGVFVNNQTEYGLHVGGTPIYEVYMNGTTPIYEIDVQGVKTWFRIENKTDAMSYGTLYTIAPIDVSSAGDHIFPNSTYTSITRSGRPFRIKQLTFSWNIQRSKNAQNEGAGNWNYDCHVRAYLFGRDARYNIGTNAGWVLVGNSEAMVPARTWSASGSSTMNCYDNNFYTEYRLVFYRDAGFTVVHNSTYANNIKVTSYDIDRSLES